VECIAARYLADMWRKVGIEFDSGSSSATYSTSIVVPDVWKLCACVPKVHTSQTRASVHGPDFFYH